MSQDVDIFGELDSRQIAALKSLLEGETTEQAAHAAGVRRETVSRWFNNNWEFKAAYNAGMRRLQEHAAGRLYALVDSALDVVRDAITKGDVRSALALLKGIGLLRGSPVRIGSGDPERLEAETELLDKRFHDLWVSTIGSRLS
jgi:hypothetical protein